MALFLFFFPFKFLVWKSNIFKINCQKQGKKLKIQLTNDHIVKWSDVYECVWFIFSSSGCLCVSQTDFFLNMYSFFFSSRIFQFQNTTTVVREPMQHDWTCKPKK